MTTYHLTALTRPLFGTSDNHGDDEGSNEQGLSDTGLESSLQQFRQLSGMREKSVLQTRCEWLLEVYGNCWVNDL